VHDVVAHLAGVMHDVAAGNMEGAATEPWTAAQVVRGRGKSVAEILDEWTAAAAGFEEFLSSPDGGKGGSAVVDVSAHETDLRTALGLAPAVPDEALAWIAGRLREGFDSQVAAAGLPPVTIDVSDFEMFRGRLGRRTREEVSAFGWSADPAAYLDTFFLFGPAASPVGL
jgi:uncharacterized protein (TIGR03083 family)